MSEAAAANALGLSTHVPARIVYLTNGTSRTYRIGKTEIRFKQAGPRRLAGAGTLAGTLLQAPEGITPTLMSHLRSRLPRRERQRLSKLAPMAPAWMRPTVRALAAEHGG